MNLQSLNDDFLQLDYVSDPKLYDEKRYFNEEGDEPFDTTSKAQTLLMLNTLAYEMQLDTYALKKMEIFLRSELPFFAVTRRLVRQWVTQNFLY